MSSLVLEAVLGAAIHYAMASSLTAVASEKSHQVHMDILTIGAAGGIVGGAVLSMLDGRPGWMKTLTFVTAGVLVFDYFLFKH